MKTLKRNRYIYIKKKKDLKKIWNGLPATVRISLDESSLYESFFASVAGHVLGLLLIWLISFIIIFFGLTPKLFPVPKTKPHDIEFTLKDSSRHKFHHPKIKPAEKNREINSELQKMNTANPIVSEKKDNLPPKSISKKNVSPNTNKSNDTKLTARNTNNTKSSMGKPHTKSSTSDFAMPMPSMKSMTSGLGGSGRTKHHAAGVESSSSIGDFGSPSSSTKGSSGHSGFDKTATRKIITTYDISPYVNELKRNIRWNWKAPKSNTNKRVELFLRIAKDGRVIILNVKKTSEVGDIDNAALNAVRKSMPLNPLPAKYSKNYLDIIFTFDSNSVGSRY